MYGSPDYDPLMDAFRCEICGKWFKNLGFHVPKKHNMKLDEYRDKFGFEKKQKFLSQDIIETRRRAAKENKLSDYLDGYRDKTKYQKGEKSSRRYYKRKPATIRKIKELAEKRKKP